MSWSGESEPPAGAWSGETEPSAGAAPPGAEGDGGWLFAGADGAALARRDHLIGTGALIIGASAVFNLIGTLLIVIDDMDAHAITGAIVSDWFAFVSPLMNVLAGVLLGSALLGLLTFRHRRIGRAGWAMALGFAGVTVATAILAGIFAAHHVLGSLTAGTIAGAVAGAIATVAFLTAASAFGPSIGTMDGSVRDRRLATAAAIYGIAMLGSITSDVFALVVASKLSAGTTTTTSAGLQLASVVLELVAAVIIVSALAGAAQARRLGVVEWLPRRDRVLAIAVAVLLVALLLFAAASVVQATQTSSLAPGGYKVGRWLGAAGNLLITLGLASGIAGLLKTGRRGDRATLG